MSRSVVVERCFRHRGEFSPKNLFVIGLGNNRFTIKIMPIAYIEKLLPSMEKEFSTGSMLKYAEGELNPKKMVIHHCVDPTPTTIRDIVRDAFLGRHADQRLEQFLEAEMYFGTVALNCKIADLLRPYRSLH